MSINIVLSICSTSILAANLWYSNALQRCKLQTVITGLTCKSCQLFGLAVPRIVTRVRFAGGTDR